MTELWQMDAVGLAGMVRGREVSARAVTESALARLEAVNPSLNAVVQQMPEQALAMADRVDQALALGMDPGPMAGVPVTIKVNVDQAGFATTGGLRLQRDTMAEVNNPVVGNLLAAGAVVIGRTNTPAFSMRWHTDNALHGATVNPHGRGITPGGSSGGAASAVAAGIGAVAHGNDIGGSIRYPAFACGVHGLRPTMGRVPSRNDSAKAELALSQTLMSVQGPLARSIRDLSLALGVMARADARDPWHVPVPLQGPDYPRRAALCIRPDGLETAPEVEAALRAAAARLIDAGWQVEEMDRLPPLKAAAAMQLPLWFGGVGFAQLRAMVAAEGDPGTVALMDSALVRAVTEPDLEGYNTLLRQRMSMLRSWLVFMVDWPLVLIPVSSRLPFAPDEDIRSDAGTAAIFAAQMTQLALPVLGLPGLSVAMDPVGGVPNGVQLVVSRFREDIALAAAEAIASRGAPVLPIDPR